MKRNKLHNQHNTVMSESCSLNNSQQFMTSNASNSQNFQDMRNQIPRSAIIPSSQSNNFSQNQFTTTVMGESSSTSYNYLMPNQKRPIDMNSMTPDPKTGKGSGSKSRKRRPKRPKNKFMQPMQSSNMGFQIDQNINMTTQTHLPGHAIKMPPQIPAQTQLQALNNPRVQMPQFQTQNQRQGPEEILNLPTQKEFHQPPMLPSQIPSQSPPQTPPDLLMSKTSSRIEDDPFKGIGFSNGGMSINSSAFPQFDLDKNVNLFQDNNQSATHNNYNNNERVMQTSSNHFDDPFAELVFDNKPKEEKKMLAIEKPQPVDIPPLRMDMVTPHNNEQFNFVR